MTLREQLRDPIFKKWFSLEPREPVMATNTPPWFIYVQEIEGGPWRRAECKSWKKGYKFVRKNIKKYHDISLTHKRREFRPPVVRQLGKRKYHLPSAPGHVWCPYCRRLTRFAYFKRHHAFRSGVNGGERRCSICGVRLAFIKRYA